jgi:Molybdopterin converting factor, small subunit
MTKALSHAIVLGPAKLLGKRGGKRDFGQVDDGEGGAAVLRLAARRGWLRARRRTVRRCTPRSRPATACAGRANACGWRMDGSFAAWSDPPREGSEVVFIPPVSGG